MPETVVLKDEVTASEIAEHENVLTEAIMDEQPRAMEVAEKQELAKDFGIKKYNSEQQEAMKELERQQEERDRDRKYQEANSDPDKLTGIPEIFEYDPPRVDHASDVQRKSDDHFLIALDSTMERIPALINPQHSEGHSPQLRHKQQAESHPLTVGSMVIVTVGDRDVHGTIRWMGDIPNVPNVIAGVELVSVCVCVCVCVCVHVCVDMIV